MCDMGGVICSPALGGIIEMKGKVGRMAFARITWLYPTVGQHFQSPVLKISEFFHISLSWRKFQTKQTEFADSWFSHSPWGFGALEVQQHCASCE